MIETRITPAPERAAGRRSRHRDSFFLSATICRAAAPAEAVAVRVRNLSAIGLMADYSEVAAVGEPVVVAMRGIGKAAGTVAWVRTGRIGITFDSEVDPMKARKPLPCGR